MPPLVITLNEVEVVHLERVQFGLKNFDMVRVKSSPHLTALNQRARSLSSATCAYTPQLGDRPLERTLSTKPVVHINTVPMAQLESVKEWLDSVDILYSEGVRALCR
jgi:nucleosome binding factor SPN SPT16 subunit